MTPPPRIALVDCNDFYASCERVFRPDWWQRPIAVLSNNDGCIIARSQELKDAGVPMAPYFQVKDRLDRLGAVVVSSNYALYGDLSARVMDTLAAFTPQLEPYSIDEAWLDLTGVDLAALAAYGRKIVAHTRRDTGIPVSMGIAPTKVLAKIANRLAKKRRLPGGVCDLGAGDDLRAVLAPLDVAQVWGVGRRQAAALAALDIHTAWDLATADAAWIRQKFDVTMERVVRELQAIPCIGPEDVGAKRHIVRSRSFGQKIAGRDALAAAVATHVHAACTALRRQGSVAGGLQVHLGAGSGGAGSAGSGGSRGAATRRQRWALAATFDTPTADTLKMTAAAGRLVARLYRPGVRYGRAGVMLFDTCPHDGVQHGLLNPADDARARRLNAALDAVNGRFGREKMMPATGRLSGDWQMKQDRLTPAYTTDWAALPVVR